MPISVELAIMSWCLVDHRLLLAEVECHPEQFGTFEIRERRHEFRANLADGPVRLFTPFQLM